MIANYIKVRPTLKMKYYALRKVLKGELSIKTVLSNFQRKIKLKSGLVRRESVSLDNLMIGQQAGIPLEQWIEKTKEYSRISVLLSESPYVDILRLIDENPAILNNKSEIVNTSYYKMCDVCIKHTGHFMGKKTSRGILSWIGEYYAFYQKIKKGSCCKTSSEFSNEGHSKVDDLIQVFKLNNSEYYEIVDGHHRCAIYYLLGKKTIKSKVLGDKFSYLQRIILGSKQVFDYEVYQPLDAPEVRDWRLVRGCDDRLSMMFSFLKKKKIAVSRISYADLPCSYGYFLSAYKKKGSKVRGIDLDNSSLRIAREINGLTEKEVNKADIMTFLKSSKRYDVVSCLSLLHHFALGVVPGSYVSLLEKLDKVTKKVLFLDTGQAHEKQYKGKLDEWTDEFIISEILRHTSFKKVIVLGKDHDNVGTQKGDNARTLFACVK